MFACKVDSSKPIFVPPHPRVDRSSVSRAPQGVLLVASSRFQVLMGYKYVKDLCKPEVSQLDVDRISHT